MDALFFSLSVKMVSFFFMSVHLLDVILLAVSLHPKQLISFTFELLYVKIFGH